MHAPADGVGGDFIRGPYSLTHIPFSPRRTRAKIRKEHDDHVLSLQSLEESACGPRACPQRARPKILPSKMSSAGSDAVSLGQNSTPRVAAIAAAVTPGIRPTAAVEGAGLGLWQADDPYEA